MWNCDAGLFQASVAATLQPISRPHANVGWGKFVNERSEGQIRAAYPIDFGIRTDMNPGP